jgi:hypothetical protein
LSRLTVCGEVQKRRDLAEAPVALARYALFVGGVSPRRSRESCEKLDMRRIKGLNASESACDYTLWQLDVVYNLASRTSFRQRCEHLLDAVRSAIKL